MFSSIGEDQNKDFTRPGATGEAFRGPAPQSRYSGAGPGLYQNSIDFFEVSVSGLGLSELGFTLPKKESRPSLPQRQHWLHELVLQMYTV